MSSVSSDQGYLNSIYDSQYLQLQQDQQDQQNIDSLAIDDQSQTTSNIEGNGIEGLSDTTASSPDLQNLSDPQGDLQQGLKV